MDNLRIEKFTFVCKICHKSYEFKFLDKNSGPKIGRICKLCYKKCFFTPYSSFEKKRYSQVKASAVKRYFEFKLTIKEFVMLGIQSCFYCGEKQINYGIDRIDSKKGYILDNCRPACKRCNQAKNDLSTEEFINHCEKVVKNCAKGPLNLANL